jgi:DNA modification methylase
VKSPKTTWPADKVERRTVESLVPYARNARTHSDAQVAQIAASITEWGWTTPVLVDETGSIIAGHGRVMAARKLGLADVPVMVATGWSEAQKQAYVLADNQLALNAGWDAEMLKVELTDLAGAGFDVSLIGFSEDELAKLTAEKTEGLTDPDAVPDVPVNPATVLGDTWLLGKHRLRCGDSTSADDVAALLAGVSPHLMVTDPPYGVVYDPNWRNEADRANGMKIGACATGKVLNDDKADWREAWALFPGDVAYVWCAGTKSHIVALSLEACGFDLRSMIVWAKSHFAIGRSHYHEQKEPCWYAVRNGTSGHWAGDRKQTTLWNIAKPAKSETGHGTQKPVECMKRPIENNSNPGQAVYEPFSGSGTTVIAAEMTGRIACAMELSPQYVDVAVKRWQDFTGQKATLESDGRTFEDVAAARYDWKQDATGSYDAAIAEKRKELTDARA